MIAPWLVALVVEVAVLGALLGLTDRWAGRRLGGQALKVLWGAFFAKLALPIGIIALPWGTLAAHLVPAAPPATGEGGPGAASPARSLAPDLSSSVGSGGPVALPWDEASWGFVLLPVVVLLSVLLYRMLRTRRTLATLPPIHGDLESRAAALARQAGLRKPFRLLRAEEGTSPASWGLFQPAILVPPGWEDRFPEKERDQILLHELVHLKNRDSLLWVMVQMMTCLYWFHPAVWLARSRLLSALEGACDQQVLALSAGRDRKTYGRALLRTIEVYSQTLPVPGTRAAADKKDLKRRIQMIQEFRPRGRRTSTALALVFLAMVSLLPEGCAPENQARLTDDVDRPFVDDPAVLGSWKVVDFVEAPEKFVQGRTSWAGAPYLRSLTFYEGGPLGVQTTESLPTGPLPWFSWTKGVVMHKNDKTAGAYTIEKRGDTPVMFWEWKSGDYTIRHQKPWFYVLVKA